MFWHRYREMGRRPREIYRMLIDLYPERPFHPPECIFPVPEIYYTPSSLYR